MSFRVLIVFIMLFSFNYSAAQNEIKYPVNEYSPKWIKLMYHPESDPAKVINEYTIRKYKCFFLKFFIIDITNEIPLNIFRLF